MLKKAANKRPRTLGVQSNKCFTGVFMVSVSFMVSRSQAGLSRLHQCVGEPIRSLRNPAQG
jgi:hypothetical protein